jgi:hypothetical protein
MKLSQIIIFLFHVDNLNLKVLKIDLQVLENNLQNNVID